MLYSVSSNRLSKKRPHRLRSRALGVKKSADRFAANEDGNIGILFGFFVLVLFGFIGAAVDYSRYNAVKADLVESLDAAGLAIAQLAALDEDLSDSQLQEYGRRFFYENFQYENLIDSLVVDFEITGQRIRPHALGSMQTSILRVGFFDEFNMETSSEITKRGSGKIELALVLDVTGSMRNEDDEGGGVKIESLRTAVDSLLAVMYGEANSDPDIKIAVVPFNGFVNPAGASSWNSNWEDEGADAAYHGARYIHVNENGDVDMDTKVNHYNLFNSVTDGEWKGCVESRPYPLDELDTPPSGGASGADILGALTPPDGFSGSDDDFESRIADAFNDAPEFSLSLGALSDSDNSRWVPLFFPDGLNCAANFRGRCPNFHGDSWWTRTVNFTIGGSPFSQHFWRSWFTDPSYDGRTEGHYENRGFLVDEEYIGRFGGEPTGRYAKVVADFRGLNSGGLTSDEQAWRTMMLDYGVNEFFDATVTAPFDLSTANYDEYILRMTYVGWWDPSTQRYLYKYDQNPSIDESISDADSTMRGPNNGCPEAILPLTSTRSDVVARLETLHPAGSTNIANGAMWGWRVLSPGAPFTEGASYTDNTWQKAIILMTDGANTTEYTNINTGATVTVDTHLMSLLTSYGFGVEERMGVDVNTGSEMRDEFNDKLIRICQRMKDEGILVYSIVFGLDDVNTEEIFRACATTPNAPFYQKAPSGDELEAAFGDIAQDLVQLHVSQ